MESILVIQRGQLFQVSKVISDISPPLFQLIDLQKSPVPGRFYRQQLIKSPPPKEDDYFFIEKVLKERKVKGRKEYFVKYLYYPNKFNQWIPSTNIKKGSS